MDERDADRQEQSEQVDPVAEESAEQTPPRDEASLLKRLRTRTRDGHAEDGGDRIAQQFAAQWAQLRAERRSEPAPVGAGTTNFTRAQVPWGVDLAAAWSWRILIIGAALYGVLWIMAFFAVVTLPLVIALLIAALCNPAVAWLQRIGLPRAFAAILVVISGIGVVAALITFVSQQVIVGAQDLADQVVVGLDEIRRWLREGPLEASDSQINDWITNVQEAITARSADDRGVVNQVTEVGTAVGHVVAGMFIVLFATYFFLADGHRIWAWVVRMFPRAARQRVDSSGRIAWVSLTQFVRATVMVAAVDALGIMLVAWLLDMPLILPIGVLVFLGAFIPMVGATVAGSVAVLVALVAHGPLTALLMLGGVILVQQIEGHILQPFLMGRFVSLHPLGVIVAIGCGVLVAGIAGALIAVPAAAVLNAVGQHLASFTAIGEDPLVAAEGDQRHLGTHLDPDTEAEALADRTAREDTPRDD